MQAVRIHAQRDMRTEEVPGLEPGPGEVRLAVQGRTDTIMSLAGALGGGLAGPVLAVLGYSGLAWVAGVLVVGVVVWAMLVSPRAVLQH